MSLNADPSSATANSYVTLAEAEVILGQRLFTQAWSSLSALPSALGWQVSAPAFAGATSVTISGGSGTFQVGNVVRFGNDVTYYAITDLTVPTAPEFDPPLVMGVSAGAKVDRITLSDKEKALLWATSTLDTQVDWDGEPTRSEQPLRWPRTGAKDCDGRILCFDCFPPLLKSITAQLAMSLAQRDLSSIPGVLGLGIQRAKVDVIEVEMDASQIASMVPVALQDAISCLGSYNSSAQGGAQQVKTYRS